MPTRTPYTPPTAPAEPTGTPPPSLWLPDIKYPTPQFPNISVPSYGDIGTPLPIVVGLTPNATSEARLDEIGQWISSTDVVASGWISASDEAISWLDPSLTSTTGISSAVQIATEMTTYIQQPVGYYRALSVYMPNLWPYLFAIFLMVLWIFLNLLIKFGLAVLAEILEVFRRVLELIPFM